MIRCDSLKKDKVRYENGKVHKFQYFFRKYQNKPNKLYKVLYRFCSNRRHIEIPLGCKIGEGLYIGHAYCITINENTVIGKNCNIHKGVTIGQENRGERKGSPIIGDCVWIGVNSTIVGNIKIGDDVLIAPNTYVNSDIPSHSVVFGNPCIIKKRQNATQGYINRKI